MTQKEIACYLRHSRDIEAEASGQAGVKIVLNGKTKAVLSKWIPV